MTIKIKKQSVATTIMYMMEEWGESNTLHILEKRMNKRTLTREEYAYISSQHRTYINTGGLDGIEFPFMDSTGFEAFDPEPAPLGWNYEHDRPLTEEDYSKPTLY